MSRWINITPRLSIDEGELHETFVRSQGPGGQNVNKVATAVQLRFYADGSASLPEEVRSRLRALAGRRLSADGWLTIEASRFRSQSRNREDARARLVELIRTAARPPKVRKATKPSRAAREQRLQSKRDRSQLKQSRTKRLVGGD